MVNPVLPVSLKIPNSYPYDGFYIDHPDLAGISLHPPGFPDPTEKLRTRSLLDASYIALDQINDDVERAKQTLRDLEDFQKRAKDQRDYLEYFITPVRRVPLEIM